MDSGIITLIGGTGFLGRYAVHRLARAGYTLQLITRNPERAAPLKTAGNPGQIVLRAGSFNRPESMTQAIKGSHAVISMAGILYESGKQRFDAVHTDGPARLAALARAAGVKRFIHVSSLGVDRAAASHYAASKFAGERAVRDAFPQAVIFRPSVMFGPEDGFFNRFERMSRFSPFLPLIGGGETRFQPVYVADVADALSAALMQDSANGQVFELGGPRTYNFRDLMLYLLSLTHRKRMLLPLPFALAETMGSVLQLLPNPPLTRDQVRLLRYHNVVSPGMPGFTELGITPRLVESIVPGYIS